MSKFADLPIEELESRTTEAIGTVSEILQNIQTQKEQINDQIKKILESEQPGKPAKTKIFGNFAIPLLKRKTYEEKKREALASSQASTAKTEKKRKQAAELNANLKNLGNNEKILSDQMKLLTNIQNMAKEVRINIENISKTQDVQSALKTIKVMANKFIFPFLESIKKQFPKTGLDQKIIDVLNITNKLPDEERDDTQLEKILKEPDPDTEETLEDVSQEELFAEEKNGQASSSQGIANPDDQRQESQRQINVSETYVAFQKFKREENLDAGKMEELRELLEEARNAQRLIEANKDFFTKEDNKKKTSLLEGKTLYESTEIILDKIFEQYNYIELLKKNYVPGLGTIVTFFRGIMETYMHIFDKHFSDQDAAAKEKKLVCKEILTRLNFLIRFDAIHASELTGREEKTDSEKNDKKTNDEHGTSEKTEEEWDDKETDSTPPQIEENLPIDDLKISPQTIPAILFAFTDTFLGRMAAYLAKIDQSSDSLSETEIGRTIEEIEKEFINLKLQEAGALDPLDGICGLLGLPKDLSENKPISEFKTQEITGKTAHEIWGVLRVLKNLILSKFHHFDSNIQAIKIAQKRIDKRQSRLIFGKLEELEKKGKKKNDGKETVDTELSGTEALQQIFEYYEKENVVQESQIFRNSAKPFIDAINTLNKKYGFVDEKIKTFEEAFNFIKVILPGKLQALTSNNETLRASQKINREEISLLHIKWQEVSEILATMRGLSEEEIQASLTESQTGECFRIGASLGIEDGKTSLIIGNLSRLTKLVKELENTITELTEKNTLWEERERELLEIIRQRDLQIRKLQEKSDRERFIGGAIDLYRRHSDKRKTLQKFVEETSGAENVEFSPENQLERLTNEVVSTRNFLKSLQAVVNKITEAKTKISARIQKELKDIKEKESLEKVKEVIKAVNPDLENLKNLEKKKSVLLDQCTAFPKLRGAYYDAQHGEYKTAFTKFNKLSPEEQKFALLKTTKDRTKKAQKVFEKISPVVEEFKKGILKIDIDKNLPEEITADTPVLEITKQMDKILHTLSLEEKEIESNRKQLQTAKDQHTQNISNFCRNFRWKRKKFWEIIQKIAECADETDFQKILADNISLTRNEAVAKIKEYEKTKRELLNTENEIQNKEAAFSKKILGSEDSYENAKKQLKNLENLQKKITKDANTAIIILKSAFTENIPGYEEAEIFTNELHAKLQELKDSIEKIHEQRKILSLKVSKLATKKNIGDPVVFVRTSLETILSIEEEEKEALKQEQEFLSSINETESEKIFKNFKSIEDVEKYLHAMLHQINEYIKKTGKHRKIKLNHDENETSAEKEIVDLALKIANWEVEAPPDEPKKVSKKIPVKKKN